MEYALSFGSNMGDRLLNLTRAAKAVTQRLKIREAEHSRVYETAPFGVRPQYSHMNFLNAVMVFESGSIPQAVSETIHSIEHEMGRVRGKDRFAPRPIYIDILYAGDTISAREDLMLPHPRWSERRFVVEPLADIRPQLVVPGCSLTVKQMLSNMPQEPCVVLFAQNF
jgi:2-amino-4-hydroxy-6-hydroxymethyldihydropteridine diphosphokinase